MFFWPPYRQVSLIIIPCKGEVVLSCHLNIGWLVTLGPWQPNQTFKGASSSEPDLADPPPLLSTYYMIIGDLDATIRGLPLAASLGSVAQTSL